MTPIVKTKDTLEPRGVDFAAVREIALTLPATEEGTSYGTPAFRVRGKFFLRLREDGESLVLKVGFDARDILLAADPDVFFTTPHYDGYPTVLVHLSRVRASALREVIEQAWCENAPKKLRAEHQAEGTAE